MVKLRTFIVAATYAAREHVDILGGIFEAVSPFESLVAHCRQVCDIKDWEACQLLADEAWDAIVFEILPDGDMPRLRTGDDMNYPWHQITVLRTEITKLAHAIELTADMGVLADIPGTGYTGLDIRPAEKRLDELQQEVGKLVVAWKNRQRPEESFDSRQPRSVQVDKPTVGDDG